MREPSRTDGERRPPRTSDRREENDQAVRFAVGADCCGSLSCRETEGLLEVERNGEERVLCPSCAAGWSP